MSLSHQQYLEVLPLLTLCHPKLQIQVISNFIYFIASIKMLKKVAETASTVVSGSFSINFVLALVLGLSLKQLWLLMNTL